MQPSGSSAGEVDSGDLDPRPLLSCLQFPEISHRRGEPRTVSSGLGRTGLNDIGVASDEGTIKLIIC